MKTVTIECRQYGEWDEAVQATILEKHRDINTDHDWWEFTVEDAKRIGSLMGIEIKDLFFSGFWSQGDGACFSGSYSYAKGGAAKVREEAPKDEELHRISKALQDLQQPNFYQLTATVEQSGHYYHEYCTDIRVFAGDGYDAEAQTDETLTTILRDYMRWIYRQLEEEHNYNSAEEQIIATLKANGYEFDSSGEIH